MDYRVIIIDDNESIHDDFKKILQGEESLSSQLEDMEKELFSADASTPSKDIEENQFELEFAIQGQEGFEKVKAAHESGNPFHVAFVDMRMPPGWDGLETARHILQNDPNIQIVFCTAFSDYSWDQLTAEIKEASRWLILKKPFDRIEVLQLAHSLCQKWMYASQANMKLETMQKMVNEQTKEIEESYKEKEQLNAVYAQSSHMAFLGEMAGGMAHEINNPLAIIKGYLRVLKRTISKEEIDIQMAEEAINCTDVSIERITEIIDSLQHFSANALGEKKEELNFEHIIEECKSFTKGSLSKHNIELKTEIADAPLLVNKSHILQALIVVMNNSMDAIEGEDGEICIDSKVVDDKLIIDFTDNGKGIAEDIQDQIFNPFVTTKVDQKKTGMGLSIAFQIISNHRGTIELVESSKGKTRFRVTLPVHKP